MRPRWRLVGGQNIEAFFAAEAHKSPAGGDCHRPTGHVHLKMLQKILELISCVPVQSAKKAKIHGQSMANTLKVKEVDCAVRIFRVIRVFSSATQIRVFLNEIFFRRLAPSGSKMKLARENCVSLRSAILSGVQFPLASLPLGLLLFLHRPPTLTVIDLWNISSWCRLGLIPFKSSANKISTFCVH